MEDTAPAKRDEKGRYLPGQAPDNYTPQRRKYHSADQLKSKLDDFDAYCLEHTKPKTVERLCTFLGIDRATLIKYENYHADQIAKGGEYGNKDSDSALMLNLIKQVRAEILADRVDSLVDMTNRNAAGSIFLLKNSHGFKDRIDHVVEKNTHLHIHISDDEQKRLQGGTIESMAGEALDAEFSVSEVDVVDK